MIGYYNYTVILTYIGTLFGFSGITCILNNKLQMSLICLLCAGFCDMFDGKIASTMKRNKQEKRFGIQIDSLSDLVCFGVLPALIVYQHSDKGTMRSIICVLYLLCALIRLAWFNVNEEERQDQEVGSRENYLGLPVTSSALLIPFFVGCTHLLNLQNHSLSVWLLACIAAAFVTPFHLRKPGKLGKILLLILGYTALMVVLIGVKV